MINTQEIKTNSRIDFEAKRKELDKLGYCVIKNILDHDFLIELNAFCTDLRNEIPSEHFASQISTGSMITIDNHLYFSKLVSWQPTLSALKKLNFKDTVWSTGYLISKPPKSPPLFWHQDAWYWNDSDAYSNTTHQLFLMYYLVDTTINNGCLRVIPGSHHKRHEIHNFVSEAHNDKIRLAENLNHPAYKSHPDEQNIQVKAGDLVIGDARLLHSAQANNLKYERPVITL